MLTLAFFDQMHDPEMWFRLLSIIIIDLTLAGDNALVIALAVRSLPPQQQFWGRIWGTIGAVGLRLIFIFLVSYALRVPLLQAIGGLVLLWIAYKLVQPQQAHGDDVKPAGNLSEAVRIIVIADVIMSLDNVLAVAGAAQGHFGLVVFGILFSLPLVVWGSGLLAKLMNSYQWIIWVGGGVLGYVAGELFFKDPLVIKWLGAELTGKLHDPIAWGLGIVLAFLGWFFARKAGGKKATASPAPVIDP